MKLKINFKDGRNMLVVRLSELAESRYVPKRERISLKIPCKRKDGIWDVMGYYDKKRKIVTICDKVIQKGV